MSDKRASVEVKTDGPGYLVWRSELLAQLALARVPGLNVHKRADGQPASMPFDLLVCTENGFCFLVVVRGFSSARLGIERVESIDELRCPLDAELVRQARENYSPVILFLFDADKDHGRFLRLDTLPDPGPHARHVTARLPVKDTLNKGSVERLITDLQDVVKSSSA